MTERTATMRGCGKWTALALGRPGGPELSKCRESREHSTKPEPAGALETAVLVWGMADAAGGMRDWTDSWLDDRKALRVLRGGSRVECAAGVPPHVLRSR